SSRRRHTRFSRDWSSDVCSSDLEQVSHVLTALADGDLGVRMDGEYQGVFATMRDNANATVAQLTGIVARIQESADQIGSAATERSEERRVGKACVAGWRTLRS